MAVIEEALHYINARIRSLTGPMDPEDRQELGAACTEALDALADLRTSGRNFP